MRSLTRPYFTLLCIICATGAHADERIGQPIPGFTLYDCFGEMHSYPGPHHAGPTVVVFLGAECPLAKLYAPRLEKLHQQFRSQGVSFLGICSNLQDSTTSLLHYARDHGLTFPLLRDSDQAVADLFAAQRTPEVFLLDGHQIVRYHGRIDNQYAVGVLTPQPTERYLHAALRELLDGRAVSTPSTEPLGCLIGRVYDEQPDADSDVTWSNQIVRILQKNCQDCHRPGQIGPFSLLTYEEARGWGPMIREVVSTRRMPPWHADPAHGDFSNDPRLSENEIELIAGWVQNGAPQGDPTHLPSPRDYTEGWQIPQPDQIVYMSDQPFVVPAEGQVEYQWFTVDPGFNSDKWVKLIEARPGNPAVVHHVTVFFWPPGVDWDLRLGERINLLGGYSPGKRPITLGEWDGTARFVPAGSKLVFEMHYTPNGTVQTDRSAIAMLFADPAEVRQQLSVVMAANVEFELPPYSDNHAVSASYQFDEDSLLHAVSPHMHLRGKSFQFVAHYPTGVKEILLNVPHFDFNWQTDYQFRQPRHMPRGTTIECLAAYDNSPSNPRNPDPSQAVRWGDQIWDEMMIGGLAITPAHQDLTQDQGRPLVAGSRARTWRWTGVGAAFCFIFAAGAVGYKRIRKTRPNHR